MMPSSKACVIKAEIILLRSGRGSGYHIHRPEVADGKSRLSRHGYSLSVTSALGSQSAPPHCYHETGSLARSVRCSVRERENDAPPTMAEELAKQLASYKAQLQQVEAALSTDADNEDLLKLQKDLTEVIELTKDLLASQPSEAPEDPDSFSSVSGTHAWKVGDRCMAVWTEDGQLYEAEIEEIDEENGTAAITFQGYGNAEVTSLLNLKPAEEGRKSKDDSSSLPMSKKELVAQQREYKKKKALKKAARIKELEQEREDQKSKWQQFNNKAYSKNKKGQVKRSIFASPESVTGKVGVGTCGIADKPMTQYQDTSKYNVRHLMPQ